jgi:hypothetical protein
MVAIEMHMPFVVSNSSGHEANCECGYRGHKYLYLASAELDARIHRLQYGLTACPYCGNEVATDPLRCEHCQELL